MSEWRSPRLSASQIMSYSTVIMTWRAIVYTRWSGTRVDASFTATRRKRIQRWKHFKQPEFTWWWVLEVHSPTHESRSLIESCSSHIPASIVKRKSISLIKRFAGDVGKVLVRGLRRLSLVPHDDRIRRHGGCRWVDESNKLMLIIIQTE